mgnify:CR=1 FL=1
MGYLDNSTVTVDAILTKQGRKLLAQDSPLNISYFTLNDTGVDYTTWNPDHASGSAYYGEAIENLPNVEALPNAAFFMLRNTLVSYEKGIDAIPGLKKMDDYDFGNDTDCKSYTAEMIGGYNVTDGYVVLIPDTSVATINGSTGESVSGNLLQYINNQNINDAGVVTLGSGTAGQGYTFNVCPGVQTEDATLTTTLVVVNMDTGAYTSFNVTIKQNAFDNPTTDAPMGDWK